MKVYICCLWQVQHDCLISKLLWEYARILSIIDLDWNIFTLLINGASLSVILLKILKKYSCTQNDGITCIPASYYDKVLVYATSIQNIINALSTMKKFVDFQIVKEAFSEILIDQCKPLKKNAHLAWTALVALSTVMVFLILLWIYFLYFLTKAWSKMRKINWFGSTKRISTAYTGARSEIWRG